MTVLSRLDLIFTGRMSEAKPNQSSRDVITLARVIEINHELPDVYVLEKINFKGVDAKARECV